MRVLTWALLSSAGCDSEPGSVELPAITTDTLFAELSDLNALAQPASVPFESRLASSYDRKAQPTSDWFANEDYGNYLRQDGDEFVMMEADGPGAITRIWSANTQGTLRVYVDGATTPVIAAPMDELLSGHVAPYASPFAFQAALGRNFYFPIAFEHGARVTTTAGDIYYQVDYRSYPLGTQVETFDPARDNANSLGRANDSLSMIDSEEKRTATATLNSGEQAWTKLAKQAGALTWLELKPEQTDEASLRGTMLELRFDGTTTVRAPLGDFFGSGPGLNPTKSLALEMRSDGKLVSRFVMPFSHNAELRVLRATAAAMRVHARYRIERSNSSEPVLYFHAGWTGLKSVNVFDPQELNLLSLEGSGHYVGMTFNVANPDPQWWGEGDEKIFVDDEPFPSHFGTGTEDYFGYGFCSTELFETPFNGQSRANRSDNAGYVSLHRLHMLDRIPFQRSLRFDLEALTWATTHRSPEVTFDATYYWYGSEDARDLNDSPPAERWLVPHLPPETIQRDGDDFASCD